jgi:hypothetical protein
MFVAKRSHFSKFATRLLLAFAIVGAVSANYARAQVSWPTARDSSRPIGSWLTTYQIAVFGGNTPILLSFTGDGILIETDTPLPTPFGGSIGTVVLSNGHGAWKQTGERTFAFTYKKEIFHTDGSSYGVAQTDGTAAVSSDGAHLEINLTLLKVTDNEGNVAFSTTGTGTAARIVVDDKN